MARPALMRPQRRITQAELETHLLQIENILLAHDESIRELNDQSGRSCYPHLIRSSSFFLAP